jgi:polar amino acid transport system substrate-binding protein
MSRKSTLSRVRAGIAAVAIAAFALTGCAPADTAATDESAITTITPGKLTIGTGLPAYPPYVIDDAPESGEGFEAAVAYAIAAELGFAPEDVVWVRTDFNGAIQPGPKDFDFNLQQYSITAERAEFIDFSDPYYVSSQTVITIEGSGAENAATLADLADLLVGAASGTTSFNAIEDLIKPTTEARAFNTNEDAVEQLSSGQIDALVVDLPTALYLTNAVLEGGKILGQLEGAKAGDSFGLVLEKGSALTAAVNAALKTLRDNGTLAELEKKWLPETTLPFLK